MDETSVPSADEVATRAVAELLQEVDPGAFGAYFRHPDLLVTATVPQPLPAVGAARSLLAALRRELVKHALAARGSGESWEGVASALQLTRDGGPDGLCAYLTLLDGRGEAPWWSPAHGVLWTCSSCGASVRDYGPESGGPDNRESGHASTCPRHSADVRAWEVLWA